MKKLKPLLVLCCLFAMSSCFVYKYDVGEGAQTGVEIKEKNHYVIFGLAPVGISDPVKMAGNAENYSVEIKHSFVDGLINSITFGIYNPTTTTVTK